MVPLKSLKHEKYPWVLFMMATLNNIMTSSVHARELWSYAMWFFAVICTNLSLIFHSGHCPVSNCTLLHIISGQSPNVMLIYPLIFHFFLFYLLTWLFSLYLSLTLLSLSNSRAPSCPHLSPLFFHRNIGICLIPYQTIW